MKSFLRPRIRWIFLISGFVLFGCGQGTGTFVPPPPEVTISLPEKKEVTDYLEFTGNTKALESVEIRARVQGFLDQINFEPGQKVKAGDLLFVIDPRPFQARLDQQAATLKAKEAAFGLAQVKAEKSASLYQKASISELALLEDNANRDVAAAQVGVAKADMEESRLQLEYTQVKSPISGRVSRNLFDLGSLVGVQDKTLLTTVVNDDSIYVYFNVSEHDLLRISRRYGKAREENGRSRRPDTPCYLGLADEKDFPRSGKLDFVDTQVDQSTGTLTVRAVFKNEDGLLLPGLFVRVRVPLEQRDVMLVPNVAIGMDQGGRYVLVVNRDNVVEQRPVQVGQQVDRLRVIEKGLAPDDWTITNGMQRARPGSKVTPIKASKAFSEAAGAPSQTPSTK